MILLALANSKVTSMHTNLGTGIERKKAQKKIDNKNIFLNFMFNATICTIVKSKKTGGTKGGKNKN